MPDRTFVHVLSHFPREIIGNAKTYITTVCIFNKVYNNRNKLTIEEILKHFSSIIDKTYDHLQTNKLFQDIDKFIQPSNDSALFFR